MMEELRKNRDPSTMPTFSPEEYPPVDLPSFRDVARFRSRLGEEIDRWLGTINGKEVHLEVGVVPTTDEADLDFYGRCVVSLGENDNLEGYCIGCIEGSGAGIVIASDDRVFAYSIPYASCRPWKYLNGSSGAELFMDEDKEIRLELIPQLQIECLDLDD
jgi:hypothetical protein